MKLSIFAVAASAALASANYYHVPPPVESSSSVEHHYPIYTPPVHSYNTTLTPTKTKTVYPPHPPPSTTKIPPTDECGPIKTVTEWVEHPVKPTHKPEDQPGDKPDDKPEDDGDDTPEDDGESPPPDTVEPTQTGPETVETAAAVSYGASGALIVVGLVAAAAF